MFEIMALTYKACARSSRIDLPSAPSHMDEVTLAKPSRSHNALQIAPHRPQALKPLTPDWRKTVINRRPRSTLPKAFAEAQGTLCLSLCIKSHELDDTRLPQGERFSSDNPDAFRNRYNTQGRHDERKRPQNQISRYPTHPGPHLNRNTTSVTSVNLTRR